MLDAREVSDALTARRDAERILDTWGGLRTRYSEFQQDLRTIYSVYQNDFSVIWPDGDVSQGLPKVANFLALAADDRSREVGSTMPTISCPRVKLGDKATLDAEKRERIAQGYFERSSIETLIPMWAFDAMAGGYTACLVWPDLTKPIDQRYPKLERLEPLLGYPDPVFSHGPLDSFIYAYEERVATVEKQFGVKLGFTNRPEISNERCTVIRYYDDTQVSVVVEGITKSSFQSGGMGGKAAEMVMQERHDLGCCPVVIGARPTMDGIYRSEFMGGLGIMNTLNRLITMMLDDAANKVYAQTLDYDIENPEERGPGAHLVAQSKDARFEWVTPPNQPFSNLQIVRDLTGAARAAMQIPPSRSGDPNESIISAAGISASQSQFNSDVRSIQQVILAPMLSRAIEVAFNVDETWCDATKPIHGFGPEEKYTPTKDIKGDHRNKVIYGMRAGLDPINQGVMVLQQRGAGLISKRTSLELSPFVEDPVAEEKQMTLEGIRDAQLAGLIQQAAQGSIDVQTLASLEKAVADDDQTVADALATLIPLAPAPLAPPPVPGAAPEAPGVAGAAEGTAQPSNTQAALPPLAELLG